MRISDLPLGHYYHDVIRQIPNKSINLDNGLSLLETRTGPEIISNHKNSEKCFRLLIEPLVVSKDMSKIEYEVSGFGYNLDNQHSLYGAFGSEFDYHLNVSTPDIISYIHQIFQVLYNRFNQNV